MLWNNHSFMHVFIDWNWFSSKRSGPWASCFICYSIIVAFFIAKPAVCSTGIGNWCRLRRRCCCFKCCVFLASLLGFILIHFGRGLMRWWFIKPRSKCSNVSKWIRGFWTDSAYVIHLHFLFFFYFSIFIFFLISFFYFFSWLFLSVEEVYNLDLCKLLTLCR